MDHIMTYEEYLRDVKKGIVTDLGNSPVTPLLLMLQGKWKVASVGSNKHLKTKEEDWIVVEGTHEALSLIHISYEEYLRDVKKGIVTDLGNSPVTPLLLMLQGKWKTQITMTIWFEMCIRDSFLTHPDIFHGTPLR